MKRYEVVTTLVSPWLGRTTLVRRCWWRWWANMTRFCYLYCSAGRLAGGYFVLDSIIREVRR